MRIPQQTTAVRCDFMLDSHRVARIIRSWEMMQKQGGELKCPITREKIKFAAKNIALRQVHEDLWKDIEALYKEMQCGKALAHPSMFQAWPSEGGSAAPSGKRSSQGGSAAPPSKRFRSR